MKAQRIFRIFVSSTFGDFQAEREALRDRVWPALRDFCRTQGSDFQAVDLRWGVSESAGLEHETMKICLDEIAHCQRLSPRPNFLVLVGDRYGWRPLPPVLPVEEFEAVLGCFGGAPKTRAFLHEWYRRDDNAVPAVHILQARPARYEDWAPVEARLLKLLRGATNVLGVTPERRELYFLSATHLEIVRGALSARVPDAAQHVMAFFRTLEDLPDGERLTDARRFVDLNPANARDLDALTYLNELKAELRERLSAEPGHVFDYPARWTGTDPLITTDHLDALCRDVETSLKHLIEAEWARLEELDAVEAERQAHEDFRRERGRVFAGREESLAAIAAYLAAAVADEPLDELEATAEDLHEDADEEGEDTAECDDAAEADDSQDENAAEDEDENKDTVNASGHPPLVLHGPGGSGKSALLARAIEIARTAHSDTVRVQRFIGASPASVGLRALLGGLCLEIARAYGQPEALPEGEMRELIAAFAERLAYATPERPLIVFIDALDQLVSQDGTLPFEWLPQTLPPHVRLVLSVLDGADWAVFQRRQPKALALAVPPVTAQEAEAMLDALLADATPTQPARWLTDAQRQTVLETFQRRGRPLWLKLAVIEAKQWRSDQAPRPLADTTPALLYQFLARLQAAHGQVLVERVLAYIAASRHGLSDDELLEILWCDPDAHAEFDRRKNPDQPPVNALPPIVWSRLYFELEPYLIERAADGATCYAFFHRQFGDAVRAAFLGAEQALARHAHLAAYFAALGGRDPNRRPRPRTLAELPWQQTQAGLCAELEATLTDFDFAMAKCEAGQADDLVDDYRRALSVMPKPSHPFKLWENFFRTRSHILRRGDKRWPTHKILLQLAVEHADNSPLTQEAEHWLEQGYCDWVWLRNPLRVKEGGIDPCIAVLEGHNAAINGVQVLSDGRLLSWSNDNTLALWDPASGQCLARLFAGDSGSVDSIELLSGNRLVSWCADYQAESDHAIDLWDLARSTHLARLKGHSGTVQDVKQLSTDRLLSWSEDATLRLWDLNSYKCLRTYKGHTSLVLGVESLPDGRLLSYSCDGPLRLWGLNHNRCLGILAGHTDSVSGVKLIPDGRLLSWSCDGTLRLWDLTTEDCLNILEGHTGEIYDTLMISDNHLISWCGETEKGKNTDFTLRMWDLNKGKCLKIFNGHQELIKGVESFPNGRLLSWSDGGSRLWDLTDGVGRVICEMEGGGLLDIERLSDNLLLSYSCWPNNTLNIWNLDSGECLATMKGHSDGILGTHVLSDDHLLSWSLDRTIRIWDVSTGLCRTTLKGNTGSIYWVEELSNGHLLSYCGGDENTDYTLRLWDKDLAIGTHYSILAKHKDKIQDFYLLPQNRLLSWSSDSIRLWDSATGAGLAHLAGHTNLIAGVYLFPDNRLLSWSWDGTLRLWDLATGIGLTVFEGHTGIINGVHVLADGRPLSYSSDGTLRLWDLATGRCLTTFERHTGRVVGVHLLPEDRLLSWCGGDKNTDYALRLWDINTGTCLFIFEGHRSSITNVQSLHDGRLISWCRQIEEDDHYNLDHDCSLRLWDLNTGASLGVLEEHSYADYTICVEGVQPLPDGRLLSWSLDDIRLWNLANETSLRLKINEDPWADMITNVYLLDGDRLLSYSVFCYTLGLWDLISGKCLSTLKDFYDGYFKGAIKETDGGYDFKGVEMLTDGRLLLWGMDTLYLWDGVSNEVSEKIEILGADWNVEALTDSRFYLRLGPKYIYARDKASGRRLHSIPLAIREHQSHYFDSVSTALLEQCSTVSVVKPNNTTIGIVQQNQMGTSIQWHGDAAVRDCHLTEDGALIVALDSGHLFCLKLYRGNQRIALADLAAV